MSGTTTSDLVRQSLDGDHAAADQLIQDVYDKLHSLAEELLRHESPAHTLQPTALVNEAYMRMGDD